MNLLIMLLAATAISPVPSLSQSQRIVHLEDSLLAPCCYTQPVSKHMSDVSLDMRKEISQMVLAGQSDQAILNHYKALYGLQILVDPEGNFHKVVYGLPPVTAITGLMVVLFFLRHSLNRIPTLQIPKAASPGTFEKYKRRIDQELADDEVHQD